MYLSKIDLRGFKSFAKQTEIQFNGGITGIVGPNGSGKSNIADSLRWVLGEQSAKTLRGLKMEDIIFNGSDSMKACAYCEVVVTFDNSDGSLPVDFSEVSVMRRVYRSGESEYYLNRNPCRLRDIIDLFRDTGIGTEGYSIIGQGRVDEILSNKGQDRRVVFEEAAGVTKYKVRKEESERKLEKTSSNLIRIEDILHELEAQIEPLEAQSQVAKEFLRLREELKGVELSVFLLQFERLHERINQHSEAIDQLANEYDQSEEEYRIGSLQYKEKTAHTRELDTKIASLQHELIEFSSNVEKRDGEVNVILERIENLKREMERSKATEAEQQERREILSQEIADSAATNSDKIKAIEKQEEELKNVEMQIVDQTASLQNAEENLETLKASVIDAMNRLSNVRVQSSRLETMRAQLQTREITIESDIQKNEQEIVSITKELDGEKKAYTDLEEEQKELTLQQNATLEVIHKAQKTIAELENQYRNADKELESKRSRWKVLGEMKKAYEGYYSSVRNLLRDCEHNAHLKQGIVGVVAEIMQVPKHLEIAIEMTLGSALQNIVTEDEQSSKRAIEYLREKNYGRATFLPITAIKGRTLTLQEKSTLQSQGYVGIASELVSFDNKFVGIIQNLLGRTVIVEDLQCGIALAKATKHAFRIATLQGDIINPGGSMTGGSLQKREFSLLGRGRELEELDANLSALSKKMDALKLEISSIKENASNKQSQLDSIVSQYRNCEIALTRQFEKLDMLEKAMKQYEVTRNRLMEEKSATHDNAVDIDEQLLEVSSLGDTIEIGQNVSQKDVTIAQEKITQMRTQREDVMGLSTQIKVKLAEMKKERSAHSTENARLQAEYNSIGEKIEAMRGLLQNSTNLLASLTVQASNMGEEIARSRAQVDELQVRLQSMGKAREEISQIMQTQETQNSKLQQDIADIGERRHRVELLKSKAEIELDALQNRIWEEYELTYDAAQNFRLDISVGLTQKHVDELKAAIKQLGDVNVNAIEDYINVKERFESYSAQHEDLIKAEIDLKTLISELMVAMRNRFKSQFELINLYFGETFRDLFGGGRAELRMSNPDDVMESDIEIIAQPLGKKLQLLSLLSGGERSLTAIALLFSMLKLKPTPFCVLDEIEASLDETNVDIFAHFLKSYADRTQFILITHRKGSMAVCNSLYGVAMEEKGVSRLVSVKLAEQQAQ